MIIDQYDMNFQYFFAKFPNFWEKKKIISTFKEEKGIVEITFIVVREDIRCKVCYKIGIGFIFLMVLDLLVHTINKSHLHHTTCSLLLRSSPRVRDFVTFLIGYLVCLIIYLTIDILTCLHNELVFVKLFNIIGIHFFLSHKGRF